MNGIVYDKLVKEVDDIKLIYNQQGMAEGEEVAFDNWEDEF